MYENFMAKNDYLSKIKLKLIEKSIKILDFSLHISQFLLDFREQNPFPIVYRIWAT